MTDPGGQYQHVWSCAVCGVQARARLVGSDHHVLGWTEARPDGERYVVRPLTNDELEMLVRAGPPCHVCGRPMAELPSTA